MPVMRAQSESFEEHELEEGEEEEEEEEEKEEVSIGGGNPLETRRRRWIVVTGVAGGWRRYGCGYRGRRRAWACVVVVRGRTWGREL